jgi:hypothetical protein
MRERARKGESLETLSTERLWTVLELAVREREITLCVGVLLELGLRGWRVEYVNADTPMPQWRRSRPRLAPGERGSQDPAA